MNTGERKSRSLAKSMPKQPRAPIWTAYDLSEGFFLAHAFATVERLGILESLKTPTTAQAVAKKYRVDERVLDAILQMLTLRTTLLRYISGKYVLTEDFGRVARFYFLQYVGSYGANARALEEILKNPTLAGSYVDREQHKRAFEQTASWGNNPLAKALVDRQVNDVVDIGCGTASLLLYLASINKGFRGWGIDSNPWMCREAKKRVAQAGARDRIEIFSGDSRDLSGSRLARVASKVEVLTATGVANEFFSDGITYAADWLANIKAMFPGRTMYIADYYGQLGFRRGSLTRGIALHDFVQVISGQGVPPPSLAAWKQVYRAAGCKLIETIPMEHPKASNFIHVVAL